ncbi:DUF47 domain-containing protein [Pleomorphomonas sp. NRK KF1]|uniref:DUF47 domain-containing protein n=1 Tax=Pleomorphomonas sp. NRK KF1 TaxID=2943000 RepID=UPI002043CDD0|nr:DUF47 domain-containing protein [Pleomorphomonas sp. NRK KF1]MCM5552279.1 DUF47 domain-containing protein [Pleomorphomonas sp. NRK KF1]
MLEWFRKLLPHEEQFFDLFAQHSETVVNAAQSLNALLSGDDRDARIAEIVALEDKADGITREVLLAVRRSFITPFDRNDIKDLIQSMDDTIDTMHRVVKTILLFEQRAFDPGMRDMGLDILQASKLVSEAIPLLKSVGSNAPRLTALSEEVTRVEGHSDLLHDNGLKDLYRRHGTGNAMGYIIGSKIYGELEKVLDRFEDVAKEISGIVIENV